MYLAYLYDQMKLYSKTCTFVLVLEVSAAKLREVLSTCKGERERGFRVSTNKEEHRFIYIPEGV
jgi:hypothetical protein